MTTNDAPPTQLLAHPLTVLSLDEAIARQHRYVTRISAAFPSGTSLTQGDLGVSEPNGRPNTTATAEAALADCFDAPAAVLVRGSGTGALRSSFFAAFQPGSAIVAHTAPMYDTTQVTVNAMGLAIEAVDFNNLAPNDISDTASGALVGHARKILDDHYAPDNVISTLKQRLGDRPVVVDDNYAVTKTHHIGTQLGADLSTWSTFKVGGPEGVGAICGNAALIDTIRSHNKSGGCQVQGHEAMAVLRGLVDAPVIAALRAVTTQQLADQLNNGAIGRVESAVATNNAETIVLVRLSEPIAPTVIAAAAPLGAAPHPVGAEARYEISPLIYRVSKAMIAAHPTWDQWIIRINPNRAGVDQIMSILNAAIGSATKN